MPTRFARSSVVALVLSAGLAALPACKKSKPNAPDTSAPSQNPAPSPGPSVVTPLPGTGDSSLPPAPRGPIFGAQNPRVAAARAKAEDNMKQIMFGLQSYTDTYGTLPGGYADKTGKPGLSWRVAILPFIEQDNLFKQFKLDEPWDSPTNKKLIDQMPKVFAPDQNVRGWTYARGFSGPNTWLPAQPPGQPGQPGQPLKGVGLTQISDGTSNTILVAEAAEPVIWTKPDEVAFDPKSPPKLGGVFESGIVVGMGDGSVRFLAKTIAPKTLANAIQINDGNIVNFDN